MDTTGPSPKSLKRRFPPESDVSPQESTIEIEEARVYRSQSDQSPNGPAVVTPPKRRKLTDGDKAEIDEKKHAKQSEKMHQKQKRDAEKLLKAAQQEERKRLKDEEKRQREEEKRQKDEEKRLKEQLKEEERLKKLKGQMKLNDFFSKPARHRTKTHNTSPILPTTNQQPILADTSSASSRSSSPRAHNDYKKEFLQFFIKPNTSLAPYNRFLPKKEALPGVISRIDHILEIYNSMYEGEKSGETPGSNVGRLAFFARSKPRKQPRLLTHTTRELIRKINGSPNHPIEITRGFNPTQSLKCLTVKYLKFAEDVRPPYRGTFSKQPSLKDFSRICRNPFLKVIQRVEYDYDSEAEWEEPDPEDGEELRSEFDEEGGPDDEDEDMAAFLDDASDGQILGSNQKETRDLIPISSGLCFEDLNVQGENLLGPDLSAYRMEVMGNFSFPIDPYSQSYWQIPSEIVILNNPMRPPTLPFQAIVNSAVSDSKKKNQTTMIGPEALPDFRRAIEGSTLTKIALVEALKAQFPKLRKDAIKNTLGVIAKRTGGRDDKKWVLIS
ncbi:MAG: hypothetical protein M1829_003688 [Trizodia sp. TS-e1964]|nr:MAG: hypothetical protein M1829_003688 [Trizodia sp. TS-e1964]